jgi:ribosome modulation factor
MSSLKSKGYRNRDKSKTGVRQTGRTGHSLESCPTVPWSDATFKVISDHGLKEMEMEGKWGVDKLQDLVPQELAEKYIKQRDRLQRAFRNDDQAGIQKHGRGMIKAFEVLDKAADKQGAKVIDPTDYWSVEVEGVEVRLVKTDAEMPREKPDGVAYLSVGELMKFVPADVISIKETFAGCKIKQMELSNDDLIS